MKYPAYIPFKTTKEQGEFLDTVENRSQYIREAIEEKRAADRSYLRFQNGTEVDIKDPDQTLTSCAPYSSIVIDQPRNNEEAIEEKRGRQVFARDGKQRKVEYPDPPKGIRTRFKNAPDIEKLHFLDEEEQKQLYEILMAYCREHNIPYEYIMGGMDSESDNDKRVWRDHVNRLRSQSQNEEKREHENNEE